ncbi:DNA polymerase III subunit delta' [Hydrogenophaga sp. OTU3427]|uniref:DNA polymerase III subunit delta' n=1 Tax=Hydrogenophaga sp. OTU3427 TaxID=3043856 RepID=UPI00313E6149
MSAPQLAPWLQSQLQELLQQRGHALLLTGPSGLGQYPLALALASAWLCEQPTAQGACGQCGSCHAIAVRTHADLCVLLPETLAMELGWPLDEKTQDRIDKKEIKASRLIRVEAAREAVAFTQYTRSRGDTKVVLIYPAERMNIEAANTLLKTLEEPVGAVRFILATEAAHQLLPTIRSRCQSHALAWPDVAQGLAWLQQVTGADAASAEVWWSAAGGRPDDALVWAQAGLSADTWQRLPKAMARGDLSAMGDWPPARQLEVQQKLCHDLMAVRSGGGPRFFAAPQLPPAPDMAALARWSRELSASARSVEHPFNAGLMLEAWAARARAALSPSGALTA